MSVVRSVTSKLNETSMDLGNFLQRQIWRLTNYFQTAWVTNRIVKGFVNRKYQFFVDKINKF